ncbi:MAG: protein phosphatase [Gemmatales bacterium]|nr:MAG: protein phosphatase [Gemmatales bacterium]
MKTRLRAVFAWFIVGLIVGVPLLYARWLKREFRNFRVVESGVLYRCGQLRPDRLRQVVRERGIRTIVSFRFPENPADPPPDAIEEQICAELGLHHFRLPPWPNQMQNDRYGWQEFLDIMDDPKHHPVLIHCFAGEHRTGAYCAIFRMEYCGWDLERALREMCYCGYTTIENDKDIRHFLHTYLPRRLAVTEASSP